MTEDEVLDIINGYPDYYLYGSQRFILDEVPGLIWNIYHMKRFSEEVKEQFFRKIGLRWLFDPLLQKIIDDKCKFLFDKEKYLGVCRSNIKLSDFDEYYNKTKKRLKELRISSYKIKQHTELEYFIPMNLFKGKIPKFINLIYTHRDFYDEEKQKLYDVFLKRYLTEDDFRKEIQGIRIYFVNNKLYEITSNEYSDCYDLYDRSTIFVIIVNDK